MAHTFLNFPSPLRACKVRSRLPLSGLFSLFRPFFWGGFFGHSPACRQLGLCLRARPWRRGPLQNLFSWERRQDRVPAALRVGGTNQPCFRGCDPQCDGGDGGDTGQRLVQHRCPSSVPACGYSGACNAFFLGGGGLEGFEAIPILHGTPQSFGAGTLVRVGTGRGSCVPVTELAKLCHPLALKRETEGRWPRARHGGYAGGSAHPLFFLLEGPCRAPGRSAPLAAGI